MDDRIKQMAQEADELASVQLGLDCYERWNPAFSEARDAHFAQLVAEDCAEIVREQAEALRAMNSKHEATQVELAADEISARYGLEG